MPRSCSHGFVLREPSSSDGDATGRAGGMVFHVNGASAELTPGMGIMVNSGRLHSCTPLEGFDDCLMVTGLFHPSLLDSKPVRDRGCVGRLIQNDAMPFLVLNGDAAPWQQEALAVLGNLFEKVHEPMGELRGVAAFAYLVSLVCQHGAASAAPSLPRRDRDLDASVTEVALTVGFGGVSCYAESFRAWLGTSPSAYRRENGRQGGAGA